MTTITIRPIDSDEGFKAAESLQSEVWGSADMESVPGHLLRTSIHYGGILLGAFTSDSRLVGMLFGFPGLAKDQDRIRLAGSPILHCSHILGVYAEYQGLGIGERLKWGQRDALIEQEESLAVWTYDPLLGPNATLNIEKLGAICRHFVENAYGELDGINAGLPTDRFEVEWWVGGDHVDKRARGRLPAISYQAWIKAGGVLANPSAVEGDVRRPGDFSYQEAHLLLVEVPFDFNAIKEIDFEIAQQWRYHIREVFQTLFAEGYIVARFVSDGQGADRRNFYILHKEIKLDQISRSQS